MLRGTEIRIQWIQWPPLLPAWSDNWKSTFQSHIGVKSWPRPTWPCHIGSLSIVALCKTENIFKLSSATWNISHLTQQPRPWTSLLQREGKGQPRSSRGTNRKRNLNCNFISFLLIYKKNLFFLPWHTGTFSPKFLSYLFKKTVCWVPYNVSGIVLSARYTVLNKIGNLYVCIYI